MKDFTLDSITVTPKMTTFVPGVDYMTDYDEWLHIQVGDQSLMKLAGYNRS